MKDFLQEQFDAKPQRTPKQIHDIMKGKRKVDGGSYFSFSQRGEVQKYAQNTPEYAAWPGCSMCGKKPCELCHGRVLSEEEIKSYNSGLARKRKRDDKKSRDAKVPSNSKKKDAGSKKTIAKKKTPISAKCDKPAAPQKKAAATRKSKRKK